MSAGLTRIPWTLRWQYWVILLRVLTLLAGLISAFIVPFFYFWKFTIETRFFYMMIPLLIWLVNDLMLLTFGLKRTGWHLGTVAVQAAFILPSLATVFIFMCFFGARWPWYPFMWACWIVHMFSTLFLGVHLFMAKSRAGKQASWSSNVNDMLIGESSGQDQASFLGRPRDPSLAIGDVLGISYFFRAFVPGILRRQSSY
ncbi:hypothetical protein RhiJN_17649 [Ceratobasidium sp. AG-Ba]|nr:hypothetical protein RhiJN_17649 [Ceratobasidium sp. AG-Ba]